MKSKNDSSLPIFIIVEKGMVREVLNVPTNKDCKIIDLDGMEHCKDGIEITQDEFNSLPKWLKLKITNLTID